MQFRGVLPAITTPFTLAGSIDHEFLARHATWLIDHGATGIVALGSLGEGATLEHDEKLALLRTLVDTLGSRAPVVAAISALSTARAIELARAAEAIGCRGLMVLPPYVHAGAWPETRAHLRAVIGACELPCMLYNNPVAYGCDLRPEQLAELAELEPRVVAVKESGGDVRRMTALRVRVGDRLDLLAGLDDMVVEATRMGADGWVAGLVCALPAESIALYELARAGRLDEALALYRWFLPLLRLDTTPVFVQQIKLVQQELGMGSERVRAPRQVLAGAEREATLALIRERLATRPALGAAR
ncbi:dihydrodipicolinate synthase family protein [Nannocystaceae bacterium ST9]